ncbi:hypothetical protein FB45DRAFT_1059629 [Roridomyces roridus]|uniref:Uncharacterized protein n=1 Tax=Roridomyces roridus TaxID=1738132 RepID=A0AAD7FNK2_9AGAR|nr:hypothetical protein FB45DRAFT_1059629 [Roridomyces roridus]
MFRLRRVAKISSSRRTVSSVAGVRDRNQINAQPTHNLKPDDPNYYSTDHALFFDDPFPLPVLAVALERYKLVYAKWHKLRHIPLPNRFSSDWRYWYHGMQVHAVEGWQESLFAFAASNGEYYFWDGAATVLEKYVGQRFESHEDFLRNLDGPGELVPMAMVRSSPRARRS